MKEQDGMNLMEKIVAPENIWQAVKKVAGNKGAPGVDGVTTAELHEHIHYYLEPLRRKLLDGTYQPQPIRRVHIPKPNGGTRPLGIAVVRDRVVQQAILQVIEPIIDPHFSEYSYGFRKKRSVQMAIKQSMKYYEEGYRVAVDFDLKSYFDTIHHQKLMAYLGYFIKDKTVLTVIRKFQQAGVLENGLIVKNDEGVAQGGPLSPLLANVYLNQLDRELEKRGHRFVRYADDFVIYVKSKRAGERVLESITNFLEEKLKLTVNQEKSKVTTPAKGVFLGFTLGTVKGK
jgi:group II intron reverse transcriptase/maturase